ncbi:MAG: hypothetical protein WDO69_32965 [Pseudomonadota bacterium]
MKSPKKKNAVTRRMGSLVILLQGTDTPTAPEWTECIKLVGATTDLNSTKVLVITDGGGPNLTQRQQLEGVLRGTTVCSAVVSDSVKVRFIVATVALFSSKISTFTKSEIEKAYQFLGLMPDEVQLAKKAVVEMRQELQQ